MILRATHPENDLYGFDSTRLLNALITVYHKCRVILLVLRLILGLNVWVVVWACWCKPET